MPLGFQQNVKFRNVPEQKIEEFNFDVDFVTDVHETKLQPNQSSYLYNVKSNNSKSVKTRNGYRRYNTNPVSSTSDESNTGASTATVTLDAVGDYAAQTFTLTPAADIVQVDFYLAMANSGEEQYMKAELWSGSTGPVTKLSDGQILLVSGTSETAYSFRFRVPYALSASTEYAVVIRPFVRGSTQTVKSVLVHRTGSAYANGTAYTSTDSGITWSGIGGGVDLKFNVYTGATAGTGLLKFYTSTGVQQLFAKIGTGLYRGDDVTGAMTAQTFGSGISLVSANYLDWTTSNDTLLVIDNSNKIQKYRGSTNANYTTGTISVTNASATVTGSGTSWNTTTNAEVGEYIKLPDGKWYKITNIASNTSLTIEVSYQGSTLAGQTYTISPWGEVQGKLESSTAPSGLTVPTPEYIANHANRIWILSGNTLRFSTLDTSVTEEHFNDWDTSNNAGAIIIPSGNGDTGKGLYSLGNALFVFQRRAIWAVYGTSPANFELRNITNEIGLVNRRTLVEWNDVLIFLSDLGIQVFDGSNLQNVSKDKVNDLINSFANKTSCAAVLHDNRYLLAYTPSGDTVNSEVLELDLSSFRYSRHKGVYAAVWDTWGGGTDDGRTMFISSNQGSIYRWDVGGHDDGYAIQTVYDTPSLGYSSGMQDKSTKRFYLQQIAQGDYTMTVKQYTDINETVSTGTPIDLSTGTTSLWGTMLWGDNWSSEGSIVTTRVAEFNGLGKYFKYRFEQEGYDEGIEVLGMTMTARIRRLQ